MFDRSDDTEARRPRRIEVISGPERRREWSHRDKLAIVAESLVPGVNVSEVARRHDINPQQLFGWRKTLRAEVLARRERAVTAEPPAFAPLLVEAQPAAPSTTAPVAAVDSASTIEVSIGRTTLRIMGAADAATLALVLKSLKVLK